MNCLLIKDDHVFGVKGGTALASYPDDEAFVIDYDAITRGKFNFKIYGKIAKFIEMTLLAFPYTERDLVDIFVSGASRVVINHTLDEGTVRRFLDSSDEIVMNCNSRFIASQFRNLGGEMYLSCRVYDVPGIYFYYGTQPEKFSNVIPLENFPEDLKDLCQ
ncbi:hypothetical protein [Caldiplasma sukawensis]